MIKEKIKIKEEFKALIPPLTSEEYKGLEDSIIKEGCRDALILWNDFIIDGHNRFKICNKHGIEFKTISKEFDNENEVCLWIIDNQLARRNLPIYEKTKLALMKKKYIKKKAEEKQKGGQGGILLPLNSKEASIDTMKEVAKLAGVGSDTARKVEFIEKNAPEEIKKKLSKGEETINKAYTNLKRQEMVKNVKQELKQKPKELTEEYEIIYADPPWEYRKTVGEAIAEEQYSTLTLEKIKSFLENNKIKIKENSVLFLWVTFPLLKEGLEVMESWGFEYKTCGFNWVKLNKNGKPFFGIGKYTKHNSELCLLGIKGKGLPILDNTISQIIMTEKERHSKKPNEIREKIVKLYGDRKRVELFARNKFKNWDVYGDELK